MIEYFKEKTEQFTEKLKGYMDGKGLWVLAIVGIIILILLGKRK